METIKSYLNTALVFLLFSSNACSQVLAPLKADPAPDSGFLPVAADTLTQSESYPFHRAWVSSDALSDHRFKRWIYVAPVDLTHVRNHSIWQHDDVSGGRAIENEAKEVADFMREEFGKKLGGNSESPYRLVNERPVEGYILELAITELTPTDVARSTLGLVVGAVLPGGSVIAIGSTGRIAIEGVLRNARTGKEVFMFADREKGKLAPISLNDFTYFSHARDIIEDWSEQLSEICQDPHGAKVEDTLPITLLPI